MPLPLPLSLPVVPPAVAVDPPRVGGGVDDLVLVHFAPRDIADLLEFLSTK